METQDLVETPVLSGDANPETPTQATAADEKVEQQEQAPAKTFTQEEVDALIQKRLLKEERRVHRRVEQQLREQAVRQQPEPQREAFKDDEAFTEAQIQHLAEKKAEELIAKREREREAQKVQETFLSKAEAAAERYADFDSVVSNPALPINEGMAEFIADSDLGADLAYHLGKNVALASRIAQLSPVKAARELAKLEGELASKPKAKPSNAPEPIRPVGQRSSPSSSHLPSDNDDMETWAKKERERLRSR